jgi:hypothetical protein
VYKAAEKALVAAVSRHFAPFSKVSLATLGITLALKLLCPDDHTFAVSGEVGASLIHYFALMEHRQTDTEA